MCMKTKTSFGCGHCIKDTLDCRTATCTTVDRLAFEKSIDCPVCRASGSAVTRGINGRGRYGREKAQIRDRDRNYSPSPPRLSNPVTPVPNNHAAIGPWAPAHRPHSTDKIWDTPTREMADNAWLIEHEQRTSYITGKTSRHSSKTKSLRRESSPSRYERFVELEEEEDFDAAELSTPSKNTAVGFLKYDYEIPVSSAPNLPYRSRRSHNVSYDSSGSMLHYQESPRVTANLQRSKTLQILPMLPIAPPPEEIHESKVRYKPRRTRTDPCLPQSCCFDFHVNNSVIVGDPWTSQYEVIQPLRRDYQYTRTYPVY